MRRLRRFLPGGWTLGVFLIASLAAAPIIAVIGMAATPAGDVWQHLLETVLPRYISSTLGLMVWVGVGTFITGVGCAWIVTMCRFPGRRIFEWALLLPMAIPAYVIAYVYTDLLEYAGPVQGLLRDLFGWQTRGDYWFPEIRSLEGASMMMTLVLYPYVYLLARAAFLEQSVCVIEVARTLGLNPWKSFFRVALPLARPAIVIGLSLVLMEVLNDYGTVDFFAVSTFTLGIFDVWLNMNNTPAAAQLAVLLLLFVIVLIALERGARRGQRYHHTTSRMQGLIRYPLRGWRAVAAFFICLVPVLAGFAVPALVLGRYALSHYQDTLDADFSAYLFNSISLALTAAIVAVMIGTFMAYGIRLYRSPALSLFVRFASLGYAVPGAVLAIGVILVTTTFDNWFDGIARQTLGLSTGLLLSGTIAAVTYGYLVRFLALSFGTVEASLGKITPSMDGAARTLGAGPTETLGRVHLPIMRSSVLTAALLVFVDVMKELPMTVILRPFNFETLATFVHQYASDEMLAESSMAALAIVAAGIVPVILLSHTIRGSRPGSGNKTIDEDVRP